MMSTSSTKTLKKYVILLKRSKQHRATPDVSFRKTALDLHNYFAWFNKSTKKKERKKKDCIRLASGDVGLDHDQLKWS